MQTAINASAQAQSPARILMQIADIGSAKRVVARNGNTAPLQTFARLVAHIVTMGI